MWEWTGGENIKASVVGESFKQKLLSIPGLTNENRQAMIEEAYRNGSLTPQDVRVLLKYFDLYPPEEKA